MSYRFLRPREKFNKKEDVLLHEIEKVRLKTEEENQICMEIQMFLRKEPQKLEKN